MADDPGGVFASDAHRRVLAHLPLPDADVTDEDSFLDRISKDDGYEYAGHEEVLDALGDLEADGHASHSDDGWKQTKAGLNALNAPPAEED